MLYLVATPIGNLADISQRALDVFAECDHVLAEDTRHSKRLFERYDLHPHLISFHQHNELEKEEFVIAQLHQGKTIALISDAGTPCISDPGNKLVKRCHQEGLRVSMIPGPCAAICALVLSGFETSPFQYIGFLPKSASELKQTLRQALCYKGATICYEAPHRLIKTLELLAELSPDRSIAIIKELTKVYETVTILSALELFSRLKSETIKGEIVLVIDRGNEQEETSLTLDAGKIWEEVKRIQKERDCSLSEAVKIVSHSQGLPKKEVYRLVQNLE